ncbi:Disease resistance protein RPM1 [Hordeum vulgare]|nr:Disease resistance protein RPM1 [Hordeum vulgare]
MPTPNVVPGMLVQLGAAAALQANVATMCEELRVSLSPILSRPESRAPACKRDNPRKKRKVEATPSRRSARIAKHVTTRQQQVLIRRLCLAHEGEVISEEALRTYVDLFSRPLSDAHIVAVLALFG